MKYTLNGKEVTIEELTYAIDNTELNYDSEEIITLVEIADNTMIFESNWITFYE